MKIETEQFGPLDIDETKIICMPGGMPGFLGQKRFVVIEQEETWPFYVYQCVDDRELSFFIMNPFLFKPDYTIHMGQALKEAGWPDGDGEEVKVYSIVNTSAGIPEKITANLLGPLLINTRAREAVQLVLHNSPYSHRHFIFSDLNGEATCDAAGAGG